MVCTSAMTQVSVNPHSYMSHEPTQANQLFEREWLLGGTTTEHHQFDELVVYFIESSATENFADSSILTGLCKSRNGSICRFRTVAALHMKFHK